MDNGWETSAGAWIADMGERGDFGRSHVLDPVMLGRALGCSAKKALDVGCGEGRFCRMLQACGIDVTGIDPTAGLLAAARARDSSGRYIRGMAEHLPFAAASFDLVVSYVSLVDIPDYRAAIEEMTRVLKAGGRLLIANLNGFNTASIEEGWVKDRSGRKLYYPIDNYLEERAGWIEYRGIRVKNHHRPMSAYLQALLATGLRLSYFDEPVPTAATSTSKTETYRRVPWFHVMEWIKSAS